MNLDRENMRKIKELILFTIIVLIALWNYGIIIDAVVFVFGIISRSCLAAESPLY